MSRPGRIAGPSRLQLLRDLPTIRRSLPDYLLDLNRRYGETVYLPLLHHTYLITGAEDIRHVLVTNARHYAKTGGLTVGRDLLGQGLVSSEPPLHTRQRRLMNPMFHRRAIQGFAQLMHEATASHVAAWSDGEVVDLSLELMALTLAIVGRALFGVDLNASATEVGLTFTRAQRLITIRQRQVPLPMWLPTPANAEFRRDLARINEFIHTLIAERRTLDKQPEDLLGLLLDTRDDDGTPMAEAQLRDEITTLMVAGHETVANHLCWSFYAISQHPEIESRLLEEWNRVLDNRPATPEDLSALPLTDAVLMESLRFLPPAWTLARRAVDNDRLPSGLALRPNDEVLISQYVSHRNPSVFADPDRFDPDRWTPEFRRQAPATSYFPFGLGSRYCIGEPFAKIEAALILATIGRQFSLRPVPGQVIEKEALIVMRPRHGMRMGIASRGAG